MAWDAWPGLFDADSSQLDSCLASCPGLAALQLSVMKSSMITRYCGPTTRCARLLIATAALSRNDPLNFCAKLHSHSSHTDRAPTAKLIWHI